MRDSTGVAAGSIPAEGQLAGPPPRRGRPPSTTRSDLERLALDLFVSRGFEQTTVDDIATRAGIGRRTFFRYFASKNDVPWGDFDQNMNRMRALLAALPSDLAVLDAVREAVLDFNRVDDAESPWLRRRMRLILTVPTLQAHSMIRYAQWRQVVAEFAAERLRQHPTGLLPQAVAWAALGVSIAAYEQWLADPDAELAVLLDLAYRRLAAGFEPSIAALGTG
jgi:TetR/AcrR family transcriptional regulator, regulator of mycofactocin system